jgi:Lysophospholipase L1 and related esterases
MAATKVVCLGDSITWGFPFGPHYSWVEMLARATGIEFINRGINGDTTSNMLRRLARDVLADKPSHLVLSGCINDVLCGESFDRITWNIREMVEKAEAAGITVILGQPTAVDSAYLEKLLVRLRSWYREYAAQKNLPLIEFDRAFLDQEGRLRQELLLADGAHPSEAGYRALFVQIDPSLFTD